MKDWIICIIKVGKLCNFQGIWRFYWNSSLFTFILQLIGSDVTLKFICKQLPKRMTLWAQVCVWRNSTLRLFSDETCRSITLISFILALNTVTKVNNENKITRKVVVTSLIITIFTWSDTPAAWTNHNTPFAHSHLYILLLRAKPRILRLLAGHKHSLLNGW